MKKTDCEPAIRQLAREWARTQDQQPGWHPSFHDFKRWLESRGYGHYLEFRSNMPASDEAERWFDDELKQVWRN
ncbi:hypothetical protein NJF44_10675 [Pseudomonas guariconensis]|nr:MULTISPECIES: hypothetical protein [Pseudomonas]MCO7640751.1 hypothetical protein [Pseudomonas sp. S 311-6]MCO7566445.1 hypothetical protein [Pseudomonas mosselii]MCO7595057.1 hypothetical protein [Pseudomonas guariconensis]MCO7605693.1 hypothetical protein [Pseudomonas guariconensis]MCO7617473.1 hypothetical protein [Pseudomonas guariconensis]